jgi:hypothetical protein
MTKLFRCLSIIFFISALAGIATLLTSDMLHRLDLTLLHQRAGSLSLIFIGMSYISLQLSALRRWDELIKGILLGIAFFLWGGELFVPPGMLVTAMDSIVITIFVVDLSLIIVQHLKLKDHEIP